MPSAGFEPGIPASDLPQYLALVLKCRRTIFRESWQDGKREQMDEWYTLKMEPADESETSNTLPD
jgi:hypothetical protein